jgi:uncharacterized DUF497 family protein
MGPGQSQTNFAKHGVRFADAMTVLEDDLALTIRDPFSEEEERWITLGRDTLGRLLVVVYTWRGERVRPDLGTPGHSPRDYSVRGTS